MAKEEARETFNSRTGAFLVIVMSSLGLGNIWRFPYLCAEYGGAAFVVAYVIALLFIVNIGNQVEVSMGKFSRRASVGAFTAIGQRHIWRVVGLVILCLNTVVYVYYNVMISWVLRYFVTSFGGGVWKAATPDAYFKSFIDTPQVIFWGILVNIIVFGILWFGVKSGIERAAGIACPILFVMMVIMIVRTLMLPGVEKGLEYYLNPDWSYLLKYEVWMQAIGQGLWSGAFGYGVITVMGSYMKKRDDVGSFITQTGLLDGGISWLMGMAIIPACVAFGVPLNSGTSLGFLVIPEMFKTVPYGNVFLLLFYGSLSVAGIGAAIGGVEASLAPMMEEWGISRKKMVPILFVFWNLAALPSCISKNTLDWIDTTIGSFAILLGGLFFLIFAGYAWGAKRVRTNVLNVGADIPFGAWWDVCLKYIAPLLIIIASVGFFKAWLIPYVPAPIAWTIIIVIVGFNSFVFIDAVRHPVPMNIGDIDPANEKTVLTHGEIGVKL